MKRQREAAALGSTPACSPALALLLAVAARLLAVLGLALRWEAALRGGEAAGRRSWSTGRRPRNTAHGRRSWNTGRRPRKSATGWRSWDTGRRSWDTGWRSRKSATGWRSWNSAKLARRLLAKLALLLVAPLPLLLAAELALLLAVSTLLLAAKLLALLLAELALWGEAAAALLGESALPLSKLALLLPKLALLLPVSALLAIAAAHPRPRLPQVHHARARALPLQRLAHPTLVEGAHVAGAAGAALGRLSVLALQLGFPAEAVLLAKGLLLVLALLPKLPRLGR